MRILMLSHGYPPTVSGVTLVVQRFSRALIRRGHDVAVLTGRQRGASDQFVDQEVRVIRIRSWRNPYWQEGPIPLITLRTLNKLIRDIQPDLIHTHENALLSLQLLRLQRELSIPMVASCYFYPNFVPHYLKLGHRLEPSLVRFLWKYGVFNLNHFDRVIFSTLTQLQEFVDHGLSAPSMVVSNGVDLAEYRPAGGRQAGMDAEVAQRYALPMGPRVLFNGRLALDKKIDVLIRAMPRLWSERRAHLLLAGRGDDQPRLQALVRQYKVEHCVHFLSFVPDADLPAIFRLSDLFAIASICEVQSIPALKALASGLPIVAVNAGSLPELVHDGKNGYLVQPDDPQAFAESALRALDGPAEPFRQASLVISREHSEQVTFDMIEELYQQLVSRYKGPV
jgi:1,2-diacylglycerol 3-alpha-glucosyltransferase